MKRPTNWPFFPEGLTRFLGTEQLEQELKDKLKEMEKKLASAQKEAREANSQLIKKDVKNSILIYFK
jgi:hypothetical protein